MCRSPKRGWLVKAEGSLIAMGKTDLFHNIYAYLQCLSTDNEAVLFLY